MPRNECEEKCAKLKAELDEMKQERNAEVRNLQDELRKMEDRKDYYKNNFSQAEDRANDEEQEYRAEAEAFEKLRNEYNINVKELENLEKDRSKSSVSLREAEKINLQPWPKTTELSSWKGSVVHEVCVASGDRNYEDWKAWLAPCLADQPDLEALAKAPDVRFQSIDAKLSNALRKVIENAGEKSMQVKYDMSMKNQMYGKSGDFIKGRELFAMILIRFKSPDHTEVLYNAHHLYMFNYYGDDQLEAFYNKWLDIVYNMKHDDRPSTNSLRDTLFRKIEHSKLMHFDISRYRTFDEGHPEKTYDFLITMIKGYIARGKQERLLRDRERAVKLSLSSTKTAPAPEDAEKPAAPIKTKKENEAAAHPQVILLSDLKQRRRVTLPQSSRHLLRNPMPTRTIRKAKVGRGDHLHPLTRRFSATTSSTKEDVTKVTNVFTVILKRSMMPKWRVRKVEAEAEIHQKGKVKEVHLQLDPKREHVGIGRRVHAHLGANASSYMQTNRLQLLQKEPARRHQRREQLPLPLIPSLIATMKMQWAIPHRG